MDTTLQDLAKDWGEYSSELEGQRRVLVVDDEEDAGFLFSQILEEENFVCVVATSGEEAMEHAAEQDFDVLVVDKNLPGIDGLEVIGRVQERDRDCQAILVTAYANLESVLAAIDLRAVDYLTKPLPDISILAAAVDRAIGRRRRRLLARRMLEDLREAVHARVDDSDLSMLSEVRDNIEKFRRRLKSKRVVLIAEQELQQLGDARERLDDSGFGVITAELPGEALELCALGRINVIIIGATFGKRDGLDFYNDVLEIANRPELILVGPATSYEMAVEVLRRGGAGYLVKPVVDTDLVLHAVERACREQHERLYHYKVVAELHRVLGTLVDREVKSDASEAIGPLLSEFDVETARQAVALFGLTEDAGE